VKRRASVDCLDIDGTLGAYLDDHDALPMFCPARASRTLIDWPQTSPILRRAGIGSAANAPWPSIGLGAALTLNYCGSLGTARCY
jgi:hypothetical protein